MKSRLLIITKIILIRITLIGSLKLVLSQIVLTIISKALMIPSAMEDTDNMKEIINKNVEWKAINK